MKESLSITDNQLGLLGGLAFALLYTILGVPIARLAERRQPRQHHRGLHHHLVGLHRALRRGAQLPADAGDAGRGRHRRGGLLAAGPLADQRLLRADKRRASALSVYAFGIPLGGMLGAISGGLIAQYLGWRMAVLHRRLARRPGGAADADRSRSRRAATPSRRNRRIQRRPLPWSRWPGACGAGLRSVT